VRRGTRWLIAAAAVALLGGCNVGYIARGAYEEARILWNRKPIPQVIANPELAPEVRNRLETVLAVRDFARDQLGLTVGGAAGVAHVVEILLQELRAAMSLCGRPTLASIDKSVLWNHTAF